VKEWNPWTSSFRGSIPQRQAALEDRAVMWHECVSEIDRLRAQLRGLDNDPARSAQVAHDAAGILAAWSLALEVERPGPLARASRQLARSAEHPAHRRRPPTRARPRSSTLAFYLLAGARPDSTARGSCSPGSCRCSAVTSRACTSSAARLIVPARSRPASRISFSWCARSWHGKAPTSTPGPTTAAWIARPPGLLPRAQPDAPEVRRDAEGVRRNSDATRRPRPRGR
jgi:hypothetical protein